MTKGTRPMPSITRRRVLLALGALGLLVGTGAKAEERFFDSAGLHIRYTEEGRGEPVVLVHGYTSDSEAQWSRTGVIAALAAEYRVIAMDARGHGRSGKPHGPARYGPEVGLDVLRLLDHLGLPRAHIVGYSMGAHVAAQLLVAHPGALPDRDARRRPRPDRLVDGGAAAGGGGGGRDGAGAAPLADPPALAAARAAAD